MFINQDSIMSANMLYFLRAAVVPCKHLTPASSEWAQLWTPIPLLGQSTSLLSLPRQPTLSSRMGPVPWPNRAKENAVAPINRIIMIAMLQS